MPADERGPQKAASWAFWVIPLAAVVALGGGATLLWLSQTGSLGASGGAGPGIASQEYTRGQRVDIWWQEHWYPGVVKKRDNDRYLVSYDRFDASRDEWVDATRLQPRAAAAPTAP